MGFLNSTFEQIVVFLDALLRATGPHHCCLLLRNASGISCGARIPRSGEAAVHSNRVPYRKDYQVPKLECYSAIVPNKPGEGARLLSAFKEAGVNFVGIWGYPAGKTKSRVDLVPEDAALLKKHAKQLKIELEKRGAVFHITGEDHPGVMADILAKLAAKNVNVYAGQALCAGNGRFGALVQVDAEGVRKAAAALA
jgi:hypothetical protein